MTGTRRTQPFPRRCAFALALAPFACGLALAADPAAPAPQQSVAPQPPAAQAPAADAAEVRAQLDALLTASGLPADDEADAVRERLDRLNEQSRVIVSNASEPAAKFEGNMLQLRAYNALTQQAVLENQPERAKLLNGNLRDTARQTKALGDPRSVAVGDFWLLQSDLIDMNADEATAAQRRSRAIDRLERFRADRAPGPVSRDAYPIVRDADAALLRLYDDAGRSADARALRDELHALAAGHDDPQTLQWTESGFAHLDAVGQTLDAQLPLIGGRAWRSGGRPAVLHFFASWWDGAAANLRQLEAQRAALAERGVDLVSIDLGATGGDDAASPPALQWSLCVDPAAAETLQRLFAVRALPRLVLLGDTGKVLAMGADLAVLDALPDEAAADAEPQPEPDPDPAAEPKLAEPLNAPPPDHAP